MNFFQRVREYFGLKVQPQEVDQLDILQKAIDDEQLLSEQLLKCQQDFDSISEDFELKMKACDVLIEKGGDVDVASNKEFIKKRLDRITDKFLEELTPLSKSLEDATQNRVQIESNIIAKSIELVSLLPEDDQAFLQGTIAAWEETKLIAGEHIDNQIVAIVKAIEIVAKGEIDDELEKGGPGSGRHVDIYHIKEKNGHIRAMVYHDVGHDKFGVDMSHHTVRKDGTQTIKKKDRVFYPNEKKESFLEDLKNRGGEKVSKSYDEEDLSKGSEEQQKKVKKVMDEWKSGKLKSSSGDSVTDRKQAIAIAMSEAGLSKAEFTDEEIEQICKAQFVGSFGKKETEGSRGGRVIGHTKSGKPIYARLMPHHYKNFTSQDHTDAAAAHAQQRTPGEGHSYGTTGSTSYYWHNKMMNEHESHARGEHEIKKGDEGLSEEIIEGLNFEELEKGEYSELLLESLEEIEKGAAQIGDRRTWSDGKLREKISDAPGWAGWKVIGDSKKKVDTKRHPVADVVAHAENTSSGQLKKIATTHPDQHISDSAKRELERRKTDKEKSKPKPIGKPADANKTGEETPRKKTPKPVKYTPSEHLEPHQKKHEKQFGKFLNKNFDYARGQYQAKFGNVLNTDNARELSEHYQSNRGESATVHEPASAFIKKLYSLMLKEPVQKGKYNNVVFSSGGTGAGKTSGMGEHASTKKQVSRAQIVYDTNMNGFSGAKSKIDQALAAGKKVSIIHTFRDPVEAFKEGAIPRAKRMEEGLGSGRTVPIGTHIATHLGSNDVIGQIKEHYKDNPNVNVSVIDNGRGKGKSSIVPIDFLKDKKYIASDIEKELNDHVDKLYDKGQISERLYRGFKAKGN